MKTQQYKGIVVLYKKIYRVFGSGAMHQPYAIFQKKSRDFNDGRNIGLIRAAETRMAGYIIALQRLVRLRQPLVNTVTSRQYIDLKLPRVISKLVLSDKYWEIVTNMVQVLIPALKLLRIADQKQPGMDRLYHYCCMFDTDLKKAQNWLNLVGAQFDGIQGNTLEVRTVRWCTDFETSQRDEDGLNNIPEDDDNDDDTENGDILGNVTIDGEDGSSVDSVPVDGTADSDEDGNEVGVNEGLGDQILNAWEKRKKKLVHDYSITGWMLCPDPEIREGVHKVSNGVIHHAAVDRLIRRLFSHEYTEEHQMNMALNTFWTEYGQFDSRTGPVYEHRSYIWASLDMLRHSHVWHKTHTLPYTQVLGRLACRVCSKILGIGQAERSWGDVKHLKTNQRSHLSSEAVKMQATIYGASCAQKARMKRINAEAMTDTTDPIGHWMEEDFAPSFFAKELSDGEEDDQATFEASRQTNQVRHERANQATASSQPTRHDNDGTGSQKPSRIFRAWFEDWETDLQKKKDPVNEAKLLRKYGGLKWFDPDKSEYFTSDTRNLTFWTQRSGGCYGYSVIGIKDDHPPGVSVKDVWDCDTLDAWLIGRDAPIYECIADYYKDQPLNGVQIAFPKPPPSSATPSTRRSRNQSKKHPSTADAPAQLNTGNEANEANETTKRRRKG